MPKEPHSLDPAKLTASDASYLFGNLFRGLYIYDNDKGLMPEGAKSCTWKNDQKLTCDLAADHVWSDGKVVVADDYVRSFRHLSGVNSKGSGFDLLIHLKNAKSVQAGKMGVNELGIRADTPTKLTFEFDEPDPDFLYKLTSTILVPMRAEPIAGRENIQSLIVNGPYRVHSWFPRKRLELVANLKYARGSPQRPPVDVFFVEEDQAAMNLYEQGTLTFLRRLPTTYIPHYKKRKDFYQVPMARFDYIGFGSAFDEFPSARQALSQSLNFSELQKIYDALGIIGCPAIRADYFSPERPCLKFAAAEASEFWKTVPEEFKKRRFKLGFSKLGGDDIKKGMEWMQAQWKKNLGIQIDLEQMENGVYLQRLKTNPPDIFRKGVGLDRPTCLSALETFSSSGSENFIRLKSNQFTAILKDIAKSKSQKEIKRLCNQGTRLLLSENRIIPLGEIHFTMLASPHFSGWRLNEMNQLDLSQLKSLP